MGRKSQVIRLHVLMNGQHVGDLTKTRTGLSFTYTDVWCQKISLPISRSLPVRESPYNGPLVESYFDNLLPENDSIRTKLAQITGSASTNAFDILAEIGRDCVGALQLIPDGTYPEVSHSIQGEVLTDKKIANLLRDLRVTPLNFNPHNNFRISLAGAQFKTALLKYKNKWLKPTGTTPTSHILKPAIGNVGHGIDLSLSVENEWLCSQMAQVLGLQVASTEIVQFEDIKCLSVERFDRYWTQKEQNLLRRLQEDFCQALGVPYARKYQSQGGPGVKEIMETLNASDEASLDRDHFMRAQIVFYLLGATDGHAKNFSLFLTPEGFSLTPLYDILSSEWNVRKGQIRWNKYALAMSLGNNRHYQIQRIILRYFEETADLCHYPRQSLYEVLTDIMVRLEEMESFMDEWAEVVPEELLEFTFQGLRKRALHLQR